MNHYHPRCLDNLRFIESPQIHVENQIHLHGHCYFQALIRLFDFLTKSNRLVF